MFRGIIMAGSMISLSANRRKDMKKIIAAVFSLILAAALVACAGTSGQNDANGIANNNNNGSSSNIPAGASIDDSAISASEATGEFSISSEDGQFSRSGSGYTISSAGTYTVEGLLEGQLLVDAGEDDEVTIEFAGVTVKYGSDSPVKIVSAGKVDISVKEGTENVVTDSRSVKTADDESQGEGAISAKCDLKIKGSGTLVVNGSYNNGVHTTKDLTIQKCSLKAVGVNNAIKGKDSITVTSGSIVAISTSGDGIQTDSTDQNKKGVTRGDVTVSGGSVAVYSAGDGIQCAHNFFMTAESDVAPSLTVYTGSYSGYTASDASVTSSKGIKVQNELNVSAGSITIQSEDDGLHADYGTAFDDGTTGQGTVNISGGVISISVSTSGLSSSSGSTGGGITGPGGMGGPGRGPGGGRGSGGMGGFGGQTNSGADGIHADNILNVTGGTVNISSSYEGLEANVINIRGGSSYVTASDDGVNACNGNSRPQVNVYGGYLDVTVAPSGDYDGIDSNGSYTQSGGIVVTRGPYSEMAAAIDAESSISVTGGTLIVLGYARVQTGGSVKSYSLSLHSSGDHTVRIDGTSYTFNNAYSYSRTYCYSDVSVAS